MSEKTQNLLKEAIADAKIVKQTAIENARLALEEKFNPIIKEKLSAKINEMEKEEDLVNENDESNSDEVALDELLAELKDEEPLEEAKKEEESEEEIDLEDEENLTKFVEDTIKEMVDNGEIEAGPNFETEENPEEQTPEINSEETPTMDDEEEVDLNELLKEIESEEEKIEESQVYLSSEEIAAVVAGIVAIIGAAALPAEKIKSAIVDAAKKGKDAVKAKVKALIGGGSENTDVKEVEELNEAYNTIKILRKDLNDINLLNAKLLYTNKLFKSKSLNESQKLKILSHLDKAKNTNEAKLIYETLEEQLSNSTKIIKKSPIKESLIKSSSSNILANKNISKNKILDDNKIVSRFQKLAGIGKK